MRRRTPLALVAALAVATTTAAAPQPRPSGHVLAPRNAAAPDLSPVSDGGGERERGKRRKACARARAPAAAPAIVVGPSEEGAARHPSHRSPAPDTAPKAEPEIFTPPNCAKVGRGCAGAASSGRGGRKCSDCPWRAPPPTALLPLTLSLLPLPLSPPLDHVHLLLRGHGRRPAGGLLPGRLRGRPLPGAALQRDGDADLGPMRGGAAHQCVHRQLVHRQGQLAGGAAA